MSLPLAVSQLCSAMVHLLSYSAVVLTVVVVVVILGVEAAILYLFAWAFMADLVSGFV